MYNLNFDHIIYYVLLNTAATDGNPLQLVIQILQSNLDSMKIFILIKYICGKLNCIVLLLQLLIQYNIGKFVLEKNC